MCNVRRSLAIGVVLCMATARAETLIERPSLNGAKPVATCKLQSLPERNSSPMPQQVVFYTLEPPPENPLDNYERTPLGDWRMPASIDRSDPWQRLLLLGPKRPVVIDLAVFIDGRPFRDAREAWIDELLNPAAGDNVEAADGTKSAETAAENGSDSDAENQTPTDAKDTIKEETASAEEKASADDSEEKEPKPKDDAKPGQTPGIAAQRRQAPTMGDRLRSYLSAGGGAVDREEIRWLIAEWGSGPPVLLLGQSLSWQRAGLARLLAYLDRDRDGGLSGAEVAAAGDSLRRADVDANDVLDASEIRRAADQPVAIPFDTEHSLLVQLDAETDWNSWAATMNRVYTGREAGGAALTESGRELLDATADVTLRIDFSTGEKP